MSFVSSGLVVFGVASLAPAWPPCSFLSGIAAVSGFGSRDLSKEGFGVAASAFPFPESAGLVGVSTLGASGVASAVSLDGFGCSVASSVEGAELGV